MGRPKKFSRTDVLEKAIPVFWSRGYADTGLQDLEKATGVNKSGLYSEFQDKDELYVECLRHYYAQNEVRDILDQDPPGWGNIERFLNHVATHVAQQQKGCFGVNSMRELDVLPPVAKELIAENRQKLKRLLVRNISAEKTKMPADAVAELLLTFFSGLSIEQNMNSNKGQLTAKAQDILRTLRML